MRTTSLRYVVAALALTACAQDHPTGPPASAPPLPLTTSQVAATATNGKIAFDTGGELYVMDPDGSAVTDLTAGQHADWTRDGKRIAFQLQGEIWVMNADGSGQVKLATGTPVGQLDVHPSWSPDGTKIAFARHGNASGQIYVVNSDGSSPTPLTSNTPLVFDVEPTWSPDGSKIAFQRELGIGMQQIWLANADGSGETQLTSGVPRTTAPSWSPDGSKIVFSTARPSARLGISVMNADGSGQTVLTDDAYDDLDPAFSPDGTKIVFLRQNPGSDIWVMNADGSQPTQLTTTPISAGGDPAWGAGPNAAPTADAGGPYNGLEGNAVTFNGAASSDPNGDSLTYDWDFGDGTTGTGVAPSHTYADNGTYTATLRVSDGKGGSAAQSTAVTIANVAPTVTGFALSSSSVVIAAGSASVTVSSVSFSDPAGAVDAPYATTIDCGNRTTANAAGQCSYIAVGAYTLSVTVTDKDHATSAPKTAQVLVQYGFVGFDSPVDNAPVLNVAKAGLAIPLRWRLVDATGSAVTNLTTVVVTVTTFSCSVGQTPDQLEEYASGSSGLQNLGNGYYQFNWKTPKSYAKSCKTMHLDLGEGLTHDAAFQFK